MAVFRVKGDPKATDDLYSLSQLPDDRYTIWQSCIVNGVRFRCKERDDKFKTQCSGVCTRDDHSDNIYYGVLHEILELDFILGKKVFMFRCKWYNTDPKRKTMVVNHELTFIDTSSNWYAEDPFILAAQAQQVFYLQNRALGKNWMVVQKVSHRHIYDVPEHDDDQNGSSVIFQEDDASELPRFHPTEEIHDSSMLVQQDLKPETLPNEVIQKLRNQKSTAIGREDSLEDNDDNEDYDDGSLFFNHDMTLDSESDNDSDEMEPNLSDEETMA
ncbi:unnamed protein product [Cuscuta europaea]|uniref:DUF4216 domain-containing protein n=1 Tax=Cuscuta europaea TaxID=41803 RepID=A0A9P0Z719_CUSEU|nr:unnamed protein product [Cuscuta europaea]